MSRSGRAPVRDPAEYHGLRHYNATVRDRLKRMGALLARPLAVSELAR